MDNDSGLPTVLEHELVQLRQSGYDISAVRARLPVRLDELVPDDIGKLLDELTESPRLPDWPYVEPSTLSRIVAELPPERTPEPGLLPPGPAELRDRIEAAWLGRCAGNCLGKPVEDGAHWTPERLREFLQATRNYPINDYIDRPELMLETWRLRECWPETTKGRIGYVPRDDDLDYTLLNLRVLEKRGRSYTASDVAGEWLSLLPYERTYTAERATYRNLVNGVPPVRSAVVRNPYREWVGAQIRGDVFGYVHPGNPRAAALLAFHDASLSHTANGIYGEMWAAALIAGSFTARSLRTAVVESVEHVPARSRLAEALRWAISVRDTNVEWEQAIQLAGQRYGDYHWVHTVNNAVVCALALLYSDDEFSTAVGLAVQAGLDTDSNGGTVGSAAGAFVRRAGIPPHWTTPFDDTLHSGLSGLARNSIRDLAGRTFTLACKYGG